MRIRTRSPHQPASLSEAFARSAAKAEPTQNEIISFFDWSLKKAWENQKARKADKPDDLIHYWTALPNHRFDQKQLMNILKGLSAIYPSDKISDEVKAYFKTEAAFAEWFDQYRHQPHTLHRPFIEECLQEFHHMGIKPVQTFPQDFENTLIPIVKPAREKMDSYDV